MSKLITSDNLKAYHAELAEHIKLLQRNTAYVLDDIVNYDGITLKCTTAGTTNTTKPNISSLSVGSTYTDGTCVWTRIDPDKRGIDYWASSTIYALNDQVVYDNKIYKCNTAHTSTSTFDNTKWTEISAGGGGSIDEWTSGTSYSSGDLVINNNVLYKANTTTSTTWVDSEWDVIGTTFNSTSTYAQKIVINVVASYEMLLQVGDSNYCKPPIDVLKKTGGSSNTTLTLENYNNASAYTGTSDFLKIANSKAKLYNYIEYPITPQTLSTMDIGVSDEIDFDEFVGSDGTPDSNTLVLLHFDDDTNNSADYADIIQNSSYNIEYPDGKFGKAIWINSDTNTSSLSCNDSTTVQAVADALQNEYTVDFWYKVIGTVSSPVSIVIGNGATGCYNLYYQDETIRISAFWSNSGFFQRAYPLKATYSDGNWHHFAFCVSSGAYYMFTDGVLLDTWSNTNLPSLGNSFGIFTDTRTNHSAYKVMLFDEFRFSNICRWTEDFTPPTEPYARPNYNISSLGVN